MNPYAFILGREYKLSIVEIGSVFGWENIKNFDRNVAVIATEKTLDKNTLHLLGGTIRIISLQEPRGSFKEYIETHLQKIAVSKINIALSVYGSEIDRKNLASNIKNSMKKHGKNIRYVGENNQNINAGSFKKNRLGKYKTEYNIIKIDENEYFGITIACQDVDAYARRDIAKIRDMEVGMMPPKLVQILLNIATHQDRNKIIYDPFCGLGTTLIESVDAGFLDVYGSDLSKEMVANTKKSVEKFVEEEKKWQAKIRDKGGNPRYDIRKLNFDAWQVDAQKISTSPLWQEKDSENVYIISEGFLGEIVTKNTFSEAKIQKIRNDLKVLYSNFFNELKCSDFKGTIIMSFPFWKKDRTCIYFREIYSIIRENGFEIQPIIPEKYELATKENTLLYARKTHLVGREIIFIKKQ